MEYLRRARASATVGRSGKLFVALICLVASALSIAQVRSGLAADGRVEVTVVSNGWHTGLAVPIALAGRLAVANDFPDARWLEIGFGDEAFYRDPDPGVSTALRAALLDTPAVLHVFGLSQPPRRTFLQAELRNLTLSEGQAEALIAFIAASFARDSAGRTIDLGRGLYPRSRFYRANGAFTLSHTCNTWVARGLAMAGLAMSAEGVVTASDLMRRLPADQTGARSDFGR